MEQHVVPYACILPPSTAAESMGSEYQTNTRMPTDPAFTNSMLTHTYREPIDVQSPKRFDVQHAELIQVQIENLYVVRRRCIHRRTHRFERRNHRGVGFAEIPKRSLHHTAKSARAHVARATAGKFGSSSEHSPAAARGLALLARCDHRTRL